MENEKLEIKVESGVQELKLIKGDALPNFKPRKGIVIVGVIGLPLAHLEKPSITRRHFMNETRMASALEKGKLSVINESFLVIDREEMIIEFIEHAGLEIQSNYKGCLSLNPDFKKWEINTGVSYTSVSLANFIKMNRSSFENKTVAMKLVSELLNFEAKVNKEVELKADERANRRVLLAQTVTTNLPEGFKLKLPIFKGEETQVFEVQIGIDPIDLSCTLISPEVNDIINDVKNSIINIQKDAIAALHPNLRIFEK